MNQCPIVRPVDVMVGGNYNMRFLALVSVGQHDHTIKTALRM